MITQDSHGRRFQYLRLSVTDVCNFRCVYCLPNGYPALDSQAGLRAENPLRLNEIGNLVAGFADMGFWKVRLTGGEPSVRGDLVEIARLVTATSGIRQVALSTNGYRLRSLARPLVDAGVSAFNISVDSLDPRAFHQITGMDRLSEVLEGIQAVIDLGVKRVKLNAVLMRGLNDRPEDLARFLDWVKARPVSVRFIELMRTGENADLFNRHHVSAGTLRLELLRAGWFPEARRDGDGPAVEFSHSDSLGKIGIIAPYSEGFCGNCNRLRINSRGALRLCLFGTGEQSLRSLLQSPSQKDELIQTVQNLLSEKAPTHFLKEGNYGITQNLSAIGG